MNYVVVGMNHKTAAIDLREKVAVSHDGEKALLQRILGTPDIEEATVLTTCNRVEFYGATRNPVTSIAVLKKILTEPLNIQADLHQSCVYGKTGLEAITHLFEVAASVDAQVIGETQIVSQVREAYKTAAVNAATGYYLGRLFDRALHVAGRVRAETRIGVGQVSIGSAGVVLAERIFGSLKDKTVLLLGAGEVGELVVKSLAEHSVGKTTLINRSFEKAKNLQEAGLGMAREFSELKPCLLQADVLITSVAETLVDFGEEFFRSVMKARHNRALFVIDLGMPRNIVAGVGNIDNLYLYNIDDLRLIADENKKKRLQEVKKAKNLIEAEGAVFYERHVGGAINPALTELGKKFEKIRKTELEKTLKKMPELNLMQRESIDALTQALTGRFLHDPILSLKNGEENPAALVRIFRKIFRLDDEAGE